MRLQSGETLSRSYVLAEEAPRTAERTSEPEPNAAPPETPPTTPRTAGSRGLGEHLPSPGGPAQSAQSPAALLASARRARTERDWARTVALYEELLARYPSSPQARSALVPLGQVRLERQGNPAAALRAFDAYLALGASGALGEEALWGRTRALRRLGRTSEEARALQAFVAAHPSSLRVSQARQRLSVLRSAP